MGSEYTDLGDDWALIRPKLTGIDPELVEEMLAPMTDISVFIRRGGNDEVRALAAELEERLKVSEGPRASPSYAYVDCSIVSMKLVSPPSKKAFTTLKT